MLLIFHVFTEMPKIYLFTSFRKDLTLKPCVQPVGLSICKNVSTDFVILKYVIPPTNVIISFGTFVSVLCQGSVSLGTILFILCHHFVHKWSLWLGKTEFIWLAKVGRVDGRFVRQSSLRVS